jgi:hypothetical protein
VNEEKLEYDLAIYSKNTSPIVRWELWEIMAGGHRCFVKKGYAIGSESAWRKVKKAKAKDEAEYAKRFEETQ